MPRLPATTHKVLERALIERAQVKVQPLIDQSTSSDVLWIKFVVVFRVHGCEVREDNATLPQHKFVVVQCGNAVLGIQL